MHEMHPLQGVSAFRCFRALAPTRTTKEENMKTALQFNRKFPNAAAEFRRTNRYLMHDHALPHPTIVYLSMEEAANLLAYRYKTAHRMNHARLESRVNHIAAQEQNKEKVACHLQFMVVGPNGEANAPVYPDAVVSKEDEHPLACGAAYEARQAEDDRVRSFRNAF